MEFILENDPLMVYLRNSGIPYWCLRNCPGGIDKAMSCRGGCKGQAMLANNPLDRVVRWLAEENAKVYKKYTGLFSLEEVSNL